MARWIIRGYDGTVKLFEFIAPGNLSQREVEMMLSRLAARDLTPEEVIDSSKRRNHRGSKRLLEARTDWRGAAFTISVGENPYYVASKDSS